jgi:hypothetical protein
MNRIQRNNILKEPLLHFLLIGAALFLLFDWKGKPAQLAGGSSGAPVAQITVGRDALEQMKGQFERTWQRPPTAEEEKGLIEDLVRNEIFYREAVAIGLDRDDEVLKRRLRQKMEFIYEDISTWAEPSNTDLAAFMKKNREKYLADPQLSFRQVFISKDKRGKNAESDARQVLGQLKAGAAPETLGDPTMLATEVRRMPLREVKTLFGEEFGRDIIEVKPGAWAGPVRSGYGLHLVLVNERQDRRLPNLKDVRETVKRDWLVEKQKELKDAAYAKIRERYTVIVEKPKTAAEPLSASATKKVKTQ